MNVPPGLTSGMGIKINWHTNASTYHWHVHCIPNQSIDYIIKIFQTNNLLSLLLLLHHCWRKYKSAIWNHCKRYQQTESKLPVFMGGDEACWPVAI